MSLYRTISTTLLSVSTPFSISFLALLLPFTLPIIAHAEEIVLGVAEARVNTTTSSTQSTAYMQIVNYSKEKSITLTRVNSEIADKVKLLHPNEETLTIAPGKAENFSDDGYTLQLEGLTAPIIEGQSIPLTLTFAHGDSYIINAVAVREGTHLHGSDSDGYTSHNDH
jgi:copper(I)-binding protein